LRNILFKAHNILIKDCSNKTSLGNKFVRIAVRRQEENNLLIKALKQVKHDIGR
jgi:threonine-phosphate decarboxylase